MKRAFRQWRKRIRKNLQERLEREIFVCARRICCTGVLQERSCFWSLFLEAQVAITLLKSANFVNSFVSFSPFLELPTPLPIEPSQVIFFFLISIYFLLVVLEKCFLFGPRTLLPICLSFVWDSVSFALSCQNQASPSTSIYLLRIARITRLN